MRGLSLTFTGSSFLGPGSAWLVSIFFGWIFGDTLRPLKSYSWGLKGLDLWIPSNLFRAASAFFFASNFFFSSQFKLCFWTLRSLSLPMTISSSNIMRFLGDYQPDGLATIREPIPIEHPCVIHESSFLSGCLGFRYRTIIVFLSLLFELVVMSVLVT